MSNKVDIYDIIDANSHTSAMSLTRAWADTFKKYALNETEELSDDPGSSFNVFLNLTAQGAAKMMYEQAARINEVTEDTAILPKSLLNKLNSTELAGIYGSPSSTTIAFCIKEQDIIDNSIPITEKYDSLTARELVINKDLTVTFESYPSYILPYNVIVNCKPVKESYKDKDTGETKYKISYNIYGTYDLPDSTNDGMRSVYGINSPNISSRKMRYDGETYIAFFLRVFQMTRKESTFYVSDYTTADSTFTFDDSLVGFEVFRKKSGSSDWILMGPGTPEGNNISTENGYNYSYDYKYNSQNLNLIFSKLGDKTSLSVGDNIKVITYTTKGTEGNIEFPYMINNLNSLIITYNQDMSQTNQSKMVDIICLAFARDSSSTGGTDQLSLEEIREKIISKKYSRNILITNNEIINKCKEYGLDAYKARGDIISIYYRAVDKLEYKNMILSTGSNDFEFNISDMTPIVEGYNEYLIRPTDVFEYDSDNKKFKYKPSTNKDPSKNLESYLQYVEKYNESSDIYSILQACFPFFIKYRNTENPLVTVYDMNVDESQLLEFEDYDETVTLDKCDISYLNIYRNPYKGYENGSFDKDSADTYYLTFVVYTGENTLNKIYEQCHNSDGDNYVNSQILDDYNKQYLKLNIKMYGVGTENTYQINPVSVIVVNTDTMLTDGYIKYQAMFMTNNYVNDNKQIFLKGVKNSTSVSNDYSTYTPVDTTVQFIIEGSFKNSNINPYGKASIIYRSPSVKLVDFIDSAFGLEFDIKTNPLEYYEYESDIPETYKSTVYKRNFKYDSSIEDKTDPNYYEFVCKVDENGKPLFNILTGDDGLEVHLPIFEIAHEAGDIKYYYTNLETGEDYEEDDLADNVKTNTELFKAHVNYIHKTGDKKWYYKDSKTGKDILDESVDEDSATAMLDHYMLQKPTEYVGIVRNVPWTDRLYFSGETMYSNIRTMYKDIIDRINTIKETLFDGGEIYAGLKRTSGTSSKYKAHLLTTGINQYINNIALRISYRVSFKNTETIDYKIQSIIDSTVEYINSLGDDCFSVDSLFEYIKNKVPDIEYINITKINDYENGSVQTILNDTSVTNEILTVSQKVNVDSDTGDITFEPNITVEVINTES